MGHVGMKYSLASRELICDSVETMLMAHQLDGLVLVPNCDKIVPGMVMAAVRMDVPAVVCSGGPMLAGTYGGEEVSLSKMFEAVGAYKAGMITDEQLEDCTCNCCPSCGSCSGMYTANSMNCLCEAIGIALPGNGTIPAPTCTAPAASPASSASSTAPASCTPTCTPSTIRRRNPSWPIGTSWPTCTEEAQQMYKAAPGHIISPEPWTHTTLFDSLDRDRANGAIHDINHPEIHEGGLAVLRGKRPRRLRGQDRRCSAGDLEVPWTGFWWSTSRSRPSRSF